MVLRSVGYQSVPLPGVPFDPASHIVPNLAGRVTGPDGEPLPGEYVAGWLKRGPTGVIGTNKSDAAETVRSLLADLAGGPGPGDVQLPRAGLLPLPPPGEPGPDLTRFGKLLAQRGVRAVSYADWLRIEAAEQELAASLGRGARVKLGSRDELHRACGLPLPVRPGP
jgi:ferredoxin--NADP+ reductase